MRIFEKYVQPPPFPAHLAGSRRAWLREHPAWMIGNGYIENLFNPIEWDPEIFTKFPDSFWLSIRDNTDFPPWLGEIPGLTGLQLLWCDIDDMIFAQIIKNIPDLRNLSLFRTTRLIDKGLLCISDLVNLEYLEIDFIDGMGLDLSFLAELSGEKSPLVLNLGYFHKISDADLVHISKWNRLTAFSLNISSDVRSDFPWLANLKNLRCLRLYGDGSLQREGLARLAELPELRELDLHFVLHDATGLDALAKLEKLETLSLRVKGGSQLDSHAICDALARIKSIRNLELNVKTTEHEDSFYFDVTTGDLTKLATMPVLETLKFEGKCRGIPDFGVLSNAPHIKEISHTSRSWSTESDQELLGLAKITGLTRASVLVEDCTSQGLASLTALPHLTKLELWGIDEQYESFLNCLVDFPALTSFTIGDCGEWNETMFDNIVAVSQLKHLCFDGFWTLPRIWSGKLKQLPNLEEIELNHCFGFEDQDLIELLSEVQTLRRIHLRDCDRITINGLLRLRHLPLDRITVSSLRIRRFHYRISEQELMALRLAWPEAIIDY